ncbi:hypothetical protein EDB89DRAFT_2114234 [Lactarius sanguifluus]|nr:hypothetical protein EDB89DRAFT_2114234 [Lactarius sanguifluus]
MDVLFCICPNAGANDKQLLQAGLFPSTFKQIETAFTFSVLDDFLADNLECKTTAQQYYSKLQSITNQMFPDHVPNLYKQLLRASHQWRDLKNRIQSGLGRQNGGTSTSDGSLAIFCPACPQPGINLPDDWKSRNQLVWTFIMDGNFSAEHMRCRTGETDVPLSSGMAFMANPNSYKAHLHSGQESSQVICKALSYNMEDIPVALVMYDIMCQYGVHFQERVERSPELSLSKSLQLQMGIGLFHIHGHQDSCLPRFSPSYIPGAKQEVLDAHMNHSNWKKMVHIGPSNSCL